MIEIIIIYNNNLFYSSYSAQRRDVDSSHRSSSDSSESEEEDDAPAKDAPPNVQVSGNCASIDRLLSSSILIVYLEREKRVDNLSFGINELVIDISNRVPTVTSLWFYLCLS